MGSASISPIGVSMGAHLLVKLAEDLASAFTHEVNPDLCPDLRPIDYKVSYQRVLRPHTHLDSIRRSEGCPSLGLN